MLCSAPAARTRRRPSHFFPIFSSALRISGAADATDFTENSQSEIYSQAPPQTLKFYSISPSVSVSPNQNHTSRRVVDGGTHICNPSQHWIRQKMLECASSGNLREALEHLNLLNPTVLDYNALFYRYLKQGRISVDLLLHIFSGMKRFGPSPNVWTFNILFNGLCTVGFLSDSFFILKEMCQNKFVPSFAILARLLKKSLKHSWIWMAR